MQWILSFSQSTKTSVRSTMSNVVDRYSRSYRVVCVSSAEEAMAELRALEAAGKT